MSNPLDLSDQHCRFRLLIKKTVEGYLKNFPDEARDWWQVACYESMKVFERTFPDRETCNQMLIKLAQDLRDIEVSVDEEIDRLQQEGLSYEHTEFLRYEFPNPDGEESWE